MKNPPHPLRVAALAASLLGPATGAWAQVEAVVVQTTGSVLVDGAPARAGMSVRGAVLKTGSDGRVQLRMADGSLLALPPASELRLAADAPRTLVSVSGGLRLAAAGTEWRITLPDPGMRSIRTNGFLRLQPCAAGCTLAPGLYGRIVQGDAALEYQGGRAVLRNRSFRWPDANTRPEVLARPPAILDDTGNQVLASAAREQVQAQLKAGLAAFERGDDAAALSALAAVRQAAPGEVLVPYYQGLIALKREDNAQALALLQQYAREDPEGAAARDVTKTLTLLSSTQLQQEVAQAVQQETQVTGSPPEPGSIAVQAFVNKGSDQYRAMAKGLAAMIIADLSKVPGLKVLEREKVQLLVNEAKLGDSGLADTASAVRSGRLMRAEKVVVGNFEVQ